MDFYPDEIENIVFAPTKIRGFLSASSADGGLSSGQSFVHVTSEPAMIGYTRKMFRGFCWNHPQTEDKCILSADNSPKY
jgi:hypothetical protein